MPTPCARIPTNCMIHTVACRHVTRQRPVNSYRGACFLCYMCRAVISRTVVKGSVIELSYLVGELVR